MPKYSVPFYFVVHVDVEAESEQDARDAASSVPFTVSVSDGFSIEFEDSGEVHEYSQEEV